MKILILSGDDVRRALPMQQAIGAVKRAFTQLFRGQADVLLREALRVPRHRGVPALRQSVPYAKSRGPGCTIRYQVGPPPL